MKNPKISIIIPIWNAGKYLAPALMSVQNQTFSDWECICVNNGSTDDSADVIKDFANRDNRFIRINRPDNGGGSVGRNAGLDMARGEFIAYLDNDDLLPPDTFAHFMSLAEKYGADMVRGRCMKIPDNFELKDAGKYFNPSPKIEFYADNPADAFIRRDRKKLRYDSWCWIWLCLFRADVIRGIRFPPEIFVGGEDNQYMLQAVDRIKNYVQSDAVTFLHRRSASSTTLNKKSVSVHLLNRFAVNIPFLRDYETKCRNQKWCEYVYKKETNRMYKTLVRNAVRKDQHVARARAVFADVVALGAFRPEYLNLKYQFFTRLFLRGHIRLLKILLRMI